MPISFMGNIQLLADESLTFLSFTFTHTHTSVILTKTHRRARAVYLALSALSWPYKCQIVSVNPQAQRPLFPGFKVQIGELTWFLQDFIRVVAFLAVVLGREG